MYVEEFYQNYKFLILLQVFPCISIQDFIPQIYHNIIIPWGVGWLWVCFSGYTDLKWQGGEGQAILFTCKIDRILHLE